MDSHANHQALDGNECWALLLAAGQGSRLAAASGGTAKQFLRWRNAPLWWHSALALAASPRVRGLVLVFPPHRLEEAAAELTELDRRRPLGVPWVAAAGGERRQDSVRLGLESLPRSCATVLIHDSARPFLTPALVTRVADALLGAPSPDADFPTSEPGVTPNLSADTSPDVSADVSPQMPPPLMPGPARDGVRAVVGVTPGVAITDTVKEVDGAGRVLCTPDRRCLRAVQTPQAFRLAPLRAAHARAEAEAWEVTDDASLVERCGHVVWVVEGDSANKKITTPEDLELLRDHQTPVPCSGWGYDVHRYGGDRPLVLGGVPIPGEWAVRAHSDGDVLLHALMDAILGCMAAGDIGRWFPDADPRWENSSSALLLDNVLAMAADAGVTLTHADLTVVAQKPRLAPHADAIRRNVARLLGLGTESVNVKATTEEGLGFTGECQGLKAVALVSALRLPPCSTGAETAPLAG